MQEGTTYVGSDAHQESTHGAIILASGEVVEDRFATTPEVNALARHEKELHADNESA